MRTKIINILIIIGVFIGFYFLYAYLSRPVSGDGQRWTSEKEQKTLSYEDLQKNKEDQAQKDTDNSNEAIKFRNSELCKVIQDTLQKQNCLDMVMASLALDEKDPLKCSTLSSSGIIIRCQDNVYFSLAGEKNDKASCRSITDENIRMSCLETIEKVLFAQATASGSVMSDLCATFESSVKTECEHSIVAKNDTSTYREAMTNKDLSSCDTITDEKLHIVCRDTILFQKAVSESNRDLCTQISDSAKATSCKTNLNSRSDAIKFQSLVATGTLDDCDTIVSLPLRNQCHDMVIIRNVRDTKDTTLCDMLIATGTMDRCTKMVGK